MLNAKKLGPVSSLKISVVFTNLPKIKQKKPVNSKKIRKMDRKWTKLKTYEKNENFETNVKKTCIKSSK